MIYRMRACRSRLGADAFDYLSSLVLNLHLIMKRWGNRKNSWLMSDTGFT